MTYFTDGQIVRCIKQGRHDFQLDVGRLYKVLYMKDDRHVKLVGKGSRGYSVDRFIPASRPGEAPPK